MTVLLTSNNLPMIQRFLLVLTRFQNEIQIQPQAPFFSKITWSSKNFALLAFKIFLVTVAFGADQLSGGSNTKPTLLVSLIKKTKCKINQGKCA